MKTRLSVFLAVLMLFSSCFAVSAASFTDVQGENCETATSVLSALGIVEGKSEGVFAPADALTRAEMATLVLRMMGMNMQGGGKTIFTDVPQSHWAYANISAAYEMGIVNGVSADTFMPDGTVTYAQAVKMVVCALGYGVQAEASGGYPTGYLSKAAQLDILGGVGRGGDMTRGDMAVLLYNALDVPLLEKTAYGEEEHTYTDERNETILSYYLKIKLDTDTVAVTPMASMVSPAPSILKDEVITAKGIRMLAGESDAQNLLGVRADIYTREDAITEKPYILAIVPRSSSRVTEIPAQNLDTGKTNAGTIVYEDTEGKERRTDIKGATLVWNGRVATMEDATLSTIDVGNIRLVENNGNVDLVIAEKYDNFIVDFVNKETDKVYFKDGKGSLELDFTDNAKMIVLTDEKGKALTLDDLAEWDVMSVAQNGDVIRAYRSYIKASGKITEISDDEVVIEGKTYKIAKSMDKALLTVGKDAAYYLDFTGAVAAMDDSYAAKWSYGWVKQAAYAKGLDGKLQLKIFCEDATWKVFTLADRVEFNGSSATADDVAAPDTETGNDVYKNGHAPKLFDATGTFIPQLVAYEAAGEEITALHTAENLTDPKTFDDDDKIGGAFSMDWYVNSQNAAYNGGKIARFNNTKLGENILNEITEHSFVFFGRVFAGDKTKMFVIPADTEDEKQYKMRAKSSFGLEQYRDTPCISFYDVNDKYFCNAMVIRNDISSTAMSDTYPEPKVAVGIVTGIIQALNEDGMATTAIRLKSYTGADVTLYAEDPDFRCLYRYANADITKDPDWYAVSADGTEHSDAKLITNRSEKGANMYLPVSKLQPGDVIQFEKNEAGNLTMANVCFRVNYPGGIEITSKAPAYGLASSYVNTYYRGGLLMGHGNVEKIYDMGIFVKVNLGDTLGKKTGTTAIHAYPKAGSFFLWDKDKQTVRAITAGDVMPGDEILSLIVTDSQRMVIVYRPTTPEVWKK